MSKFDDLRKKAGITPNTKGKTINTSTREVTPAAETPSIDLTRPVRPTQIMTLPSFDITKSPLIKQIQANPAPHTPVQDVVARGASAVAHAPVIKQLLGGIGKAVEFVEDLPGIKQVGGALANSYNQLAENGIAPRSEWGSQSIKNLRALATSKSGNEPLLRGVEAIVEGAKNTEEARARQSELIAKQTQGMGPVSKFAVSALTQTATDPLSLIPATGTGALSATKAAAENIAGRAAQELVKNVISKASNTPVGSRFTPTNRLVYGTPEIGGRGTLTPLSPTETLNNVMGKIKSIVTERITPPLENKNELAKWVKPYLGDVSLNQVRKLDYNDLIELSKEIARSKNIQTEAINAARELGYDLPKLLEGKPIKISDVVNKQAQERVYGVYPQTLPNVKKPELPIRGKSVPAPSAQRYTELMTGFRDLLEVVDTAESMKGNWFTRLFGDQQGLGFTPFGSRASGRMVSTEQQIVNNPLKSSVQGLVENTKQAGRSTYQNTVDYLSPLKNISRETYNTAMDSSRANNIANTIIRDKFVDLEGNVIGGSLNDVMANSRGLGKKVDDYLILRHAVDRMRRGEKVYDDALEMTPDKAETAYKKLEERFPQLKDIGEQWNKYNENILNIGVKEGLITQEAMDAMRSANPNYAAMKRQFTTAEKLSRPGFGGSGGFSGQNAPIKKVSPKGSTRKIVSPLRSAVEQTYAWQNAMLRNRTMQEVVKTVQRDPEAMKGLVEIVKKPSTSYKSLDDALREGGSEEFLNQLDNDFKSLFKHAKPGEENIVRAMVNGKPVYLKVNDPEAVKALLGMGSEQTGLILNVMQTLSNATKRSATGLLAPVFSIKSLVGDTFQAAIQSENPFKHIGVDIPAAVFSSIGDIFKIPGMKNLAEDFRRSGGEYSALLRGDRSINKSVSGLRREAPFTPGGLVKGAGIAVKAPFKALEKVADTSENLNRMAAFRRAMVGKERTPENVRAAINAARESTTNFSRKGSLAKQGEAIAPYSNAAVQSIYRLAKSGVKHPVKTIAGATSLILAPKLYEFAQFNDDPDYQNLPARERYRNIIYSKNADGTFNKAPMPMEYEALAGFVTDVLNDVINKDPQAYKGTLDAIANALTPPLVSGALQGITQGGGATQSLSGLTNATVFSPLAAIVGNKSFTGAPIVPQDQQKFSKEYQYNEKTSEPAKIIGPKIGMSPMHVDYLLRQYAGDFGRLILPATSDVGSGTKQATLFKNFVVDPTFTNTLTNDFYDASEKLKAAYQDNQGKGAALPKWYDDELRKYVSSTAKGSISKQLSDLSAEKKEVNKDFSLSSEQKAQKLRDIQRKMNDIYIDTNMKLQKAGVPMQSR